MRAEILLFDLDDTLYPPTSGLWNKIGDRIDDFIFANIKLPKEEIPTIRSTLYNQYGTTMRGLQILYGIDPHEYLDYVHDVPLERYLKPNPVLKSLLQQIPIRKWIFTNADSKHALRVTDFLGINECFERIVDILDVLPYCKPMPEAYLKALEIMEINDPHKVILFEDTQKNILAARELGFYTVQVGGSPDHSAHDHIPSLQDMHYLFETDFSIRNRDFNA
jgi:putative hydrolase of the HAD superfamily